MVFLSQKDDGNIICTDYWNVLVLTISGMGNTVLFEPKSWWKDDIYCSCFEFFGDGKSLFSWAKKLMERWHLLVTEKFLFFGDGKYGFFKPKCWWKDDISLVFLAFHDIPGLGKYGFSRSDCTNLTKLLIVKD